MGSEWPLHHIGITVSSLEQSVDFYCRTLNATVVREPFGFSPRDNEAVARGVGMPAATITNAFVSTGNSLIKFLACSDSKEPHPRRVSDIGACIVCTRVDDIDAAYSRLEREGVEFLSPVVALHDGKVKGSSFVYFKDPDGIPVQLVQPAAGSDVDRR